MLSYTPIYVVLIRVSGNWNDWAFEMTELLIYIFFSFFCIFEWKWQVSFFSLNLIVLSDAQARLLTPSHPPFLAGLLSHQWDNSMRKHACAIEQCPWRCSQNSLENHHWYKLAAGQSTCVLAYCKLQLTRGWLSNSSSYCGYSRALV